jgi:DNA-binding XRE family transcriptional regulator
MKGKILASTEIRTIGKGAGARLKEARMTRGLNQAELGRLVGLNQAAVVLVEEGVLWHPSVVSGLAIAMNVSPAWVQWGEPFSDKRVEWIPCARGAHKKTALGPAKPIDKK